jgi:hypothetical protein
MCKNTRMTLEEAWKFEEDDFADAVFVRYLEGLGNRTFTEDEIGSVINWASTVRKDALILEFFLTGVVETCFEDGSLMLRGGIRPSGKQVHTR